MTGSVVSQLMYMFDNGTRPWLYARRRIYSDKHKKDYGGRRELVAVSIQDGRGDPSLKLDQVGFELTTNPTSLSTEDFCGDNPKIESVYFDEVKQLIREKTGAAYVHCFHHQVRDGKLSKKSTSSSYATDVHTDTSPSDADHTALEALEAMKNDGIDVLSYQAGRYLYINAWRNISDTNPILDNHLAVCDEQSLIKPDDYVPYDYFEEGYNGTHYYLSSRNAHHHRWFYYPAMNQSEVLLFKQFDSDPKRAARMCFHASFRDPTAESNGRGKPPPRQSIEVRCIAFFPATTAESSRQGEESPGGRCRDDLISPTENLIRLASSDLLLTVTYLESEGSSSERRWFCSCMKKGKWEEVLDELMKDRDGSLRIKKLPKELKVIVRSRTVVAGFESHCCRAFSRLES